MRNRRDVLRSAKHEAGHALLFLLFGCEFDSIEIKENVANDYDMSTLSFGKVAVGVVRGGVGCIGHHEEVIVHMAGIAGERVDRQRPGKFGFTDVLSGAEADWRAARAICTPEYLAGFGQTGMNEDQYLSAALANAHSLIVQFKDAHTAMVNALVEKRVLTYDECRALTRSALESAPVSVSLPSAPRASASR